MNEIIKIKVEICEVESKCRKEKNKGQSCLLLSNKIGNHKRDWSSWKKREREGHTEMETEIINLSKLGANTTLL